MVVITLKSRNTPPEPDYVRVVFGWFGKVNSVPSLLFRCVLPMLPTALPLAIIIIGSMAVWSEAGARIFCFGGYRSIRAAAAHATAGAAQELVFLQTGLEERNRGRLAFRPMLCALLWSAAKRRDVYFSSRASRYAPTIRLRDLIVLLLLLLAVDCAFGNVALSVKRFFVQQPPQCLVPVEAPKVVLLSRGIDGLLLESSPS